MRTATATTDKAEMGLAAIGDLHYGSHTSKPEAARAWVQTIKDEGWWWVSLADLAENAIRGSLGAIFEQRVAPKQQLDDLCELLEPIKDQCIGMVSGNHGQRSIKETGLDHDELLCQLLGVPYFGATLFAMLHIGGLTPTTWRVMAHHTVGGGRLIGAKLNAIKRLSDMAPGQDLYIGGHGHADVAGSDRVKVTGADGEQTWYRRQFSACGSLLDYEDSYAELKLYPPANCCQVVHMLGQDSINGKEYTRHVQYF